MIIEDKIITKIDSKYQFNEAGNHSVYIKFKKLSPNTNYIYNSFSFRDNKKIISATFSDFDQYTPDISFSNLFYGCTNLISVDISKNLLTLNDLKYMFNGCINLVSVNFNIKNIMVVEDMYQMFMDCKSLTSLDLSKIDVSKVTNFENVFSGCNSLKYLNIEGFKFTSALKIDGMFMNCFSLIY